MTTKVYYTHAKNMTSYSGSIFTVAYDTDTHTLYVRWQGNPERIYAYAGLFSDYEKASRTEGVGSVRANVKEVTDRLQRLETIDDGEFQKRFLIAVPTTNATSSTVTFSLPDTRPEYEVTVLVDATFKVKLNAENAGEAEKKVLELFNANLSTDEGNGLVEVRGVNKV